MEYRLICTDIDGTLLDTHKKLLPEVKESLRRAAGMGIRIALVSGRMPSGVEVIERELGIACIKACNAGTYIMMGDTCIGASYLPDGMIRRMYREIACREGIPLWIFREREWYVTGMDDFIEKETGYVLYTPEIIDAEELADLWEKEGKRPNKLLFAAAPERIRQIHAKITGWLCSEIDIACSADTFLEIFPAGVNKGTALRRICGELGIGTEQVIAFGDHELDIPLIETAGEGIAMGNAIAELKERADFVTKSNNKAGIAFALERYLYSDFRL